MRPDFRQTQNPLHDIDLDWTSILTDNPHGATFPARLLGDFQSMLGIVVDMAVELFAKKRLEGLETNLFLGC